MLKTGKHACYRVRRSYFSSTVKRQIYLVFLSSSRTLCITWVIISSGASQITRCFVVPPYNVSVSFFTWLLKAGTVTEMWVSLGKKSVLAGIQRHSSKQHMHKVFHPEPVIRSPLSAWSCVLMRHGTARRWKCVVFSSIYIMLMNFQGGGAIKARLPGEEKPVNYGCKLPFLPGQRKERR